MALNALHEVAAGVPQLMKVWIPKQEFLLVYPTFPPLKNQGFQYRKSYEWTQKSCGGPLEFNLGL